MNVHVTRAIFHSFRFELQVVNPEEGVNSDEHKKRNCRETKENTGRDWY